MRLGYEPAVPSLLLAHFFEPPKVDIQVPSSAVPQVGGALQQRVTLYVGQATKTSLHSAVTQDAHMEESGHALVKLHTPSTRMPYKEILSAANSE